MKKVLLFAVALCFMISAQAQIKTNESTENQLKSRVKRVEQFNRGTEAYTQKLDSMVMETTMTTVYFQYDERYNISKIEMSLLMGMFSSTIEYFYDDQTVVSEESKLALMEASKKMNLVTTTKAGFRKKSIMIMRMAFGRKIPKPLISMTTMVIFWLPQIGIMKMAFG